MSQVRISFLINFRTCTYNRLKLEVKNGSRFGTLGSYSPAETDAGDLTAETIKNQSQLNRVGGGRAAEDTVMHLMVSS